MSDLREGFDPTRIYMGRDGLIALLREAWEAGRDAKAESRYGNPQSFEEWVTERLDERD